MKAQAVVVLAVLLLLATLVAESDGVTGAQYGKRELASFIKVDRLS